MISEKLWSDFSTSLRKHLASASDEALKQAWSSHPNRTAFYRHHIFPRVAEDLNGCEFESELFTVDYTFWVKCEGHSVPLVFIESENSVITAGHEILKLCSFAAPLRVLITVAQWDESGIWDKSSSTEFRSRQTHSGYRTRLIERWSSIIRACNAVWPRGGLIGIVIGEWRPNNFLRFYTNAFDCDGHLIGKDDYFEREMHSQVVQQPEPGDTGLPEWADEHIKLVKRKDDAGVEFTYAVPLTPQGESIAAGFAGDPNRAFPKLDEPQGDEPV